MRKLILDRMLEAAVARALGLATPPHRAPQAARPTRRHPERKAA